MVFWGRKAKWDDTQMVCCFYGRHHPWNEQTNECVRALTSAICNCLTQALDCWLDENVYCFFLFFFCFSSWHFQSARLSCAECFSCDLLFATLTLDRWMTCSLCSSRAMIPNQMANKEWWSLVTHRCIWIVSFQFVFF